MKFLLPLLALAFFVSGCACCAPPDSAPASGNRTLVQFGRDTGLAGWQVENDDVMGGLSRGRLEINEAGNALFTGTVSLENNGGFSSIQQAFAPVDVSAYRAVCLGLKGDGKRYQLRVQSSADASHAYAFDFDTGGEWEVVEIPFADMYAIRHGDRLDRPNYPGQTLGHLQLLIGNGRAESFQLEIDRIWLIP